MSGQMLICASECSVEGAGIGKENGVRLGFTSIHGKTVAGSMALIEQVLPAQLDYENECGQTFQYLTDESRTLTALNYGRHNVEQHMIILGGMDLCSQTQSLMWRKFFFFWLEIYLE